MARAKRAKKPETEVVDLVAYAKARVLRRSGQRPLGARLRYVAARSAPDLGLALNDTIICDEHDHTPDRFTLARRWPFSEEVLGDLVAQGILIDRSGEDGE